MGPCSGSLQLQLPVIPRVAGNEAFGTVEAGSSTVCLQLLRSFLHAVSATLPYGRCASPDGARTSEAREWQLGGGGGDEGLHSLIVT